MAVERLDMGRTRREEKRGLPPLQGALFFCGGLFIRQEGNLSTPRRLYGLRCVAWTTEEGRT
jgi:hypothetical protein